MKENERIIKLHVMDTGIYLTRLELFHNLSYSILMDLYTYHTLYSYTRKTKMFQMFLINII